MSDLVLVLEGPQIHLETSGYEVAACEMAQTFVAGTPVRMLTARASEIDWDAGWDTGWDDGVDHDLTKCFYEDGPREVLRLEGHGLGLTCGAFGPFCVFGTAFRTGVFSAGLAGSHSERSDDKCRSDSHSTHDQHSARTYRLHPFPATVRGNGYRMIEVGEPL
jgi:hypothetical protein